MTVREVIIKGCQMNDISQRDLAEALEKNNDRVVAQTIGRKDGMGMSVENFIEWLYELGGELVVQFPDFEEECVLDGDPEGIDYERNQKGGW